MTIPEASSTERSGARTRTAGSAMRGWLPPRDGWSAVLSCALIYVGHLLYGGLVSDAALVINIAITAILAGVLLAPRLRDDLLRLKRLDSLGILFGLAVALVCLSLTPWGPGGANPIWAYVGVGPGAVTIDKSATFIELIKLLGLACMFLIGAAVGGRDDRARYGINLLLIFGVAFGVWAFISAVSNALYQAEGPRLEAHFRNANTAGSVFAALCVLAISELFSRVRSRGRGISGALLFAAAALTFSVCLLATASRGAATALTGAVIIYVGIQVTTEKLKATRAVVATLTLVVTALGLLLIGGDRLLNRFSAAHGLIAGRPEIWKPHWDAFVSSPWSGYGLGTAETVNKYLLNGANFDLLWNVRAIMNVYLQWLEEVGILGAMPMFAAIALVLWTVLQGIRRRNRMTGTLAGLLAADAVFLIHGFTDFGLEVMSVAAFWAWLLGVQFSLAQGTSSR